MRLGGTARWIAIEREGSTLLRVLPPAIELDPEALSNHSYLLCYHFRYERSASACRLGFSS